MTFMARAAAPTLPAWLVFIRTKRVRVGWRLGMSGRAKIAHVAPASPALSPLPLFAAASATLSPRHGTHSCRKPAPHAQHRHQGGPRRRRHHQPRRARRRPAEGQHQEAERLRHRSRPRRRGSRSSRPCSRPTRATASWPRSRAARTAPSDSDYVWIIDPLDGTTNFIHGLPIYAVSIALALPRPGAAGRRLRPGAQRPVLRLQGPRRLPQRPAPARVSKRTRLADALIGTGFPFRKGDNFKRYLQDVRGR